jgi:stearoyl-CoA desaturase (delta-9 desaturase)
VLKIALAIAGSMAAAGSVFTWVAQPRRHHAYADTPGDPHSPFRYGSGFGPQLRGLCHAHVGWFFETNPSHPERWIPNLLADRYLQVISRTATLWALLPLAVPTFLGWLLTGTPTRALATLLWAGGVRIFLLHHVTWAVNSVGHMFGNRPFRTRDSSTNFAPLALLSFGDSWHNAHHAYPRLAPAWSGPRTDRLFRPPDPPLPTPPLGVPTSTGRRTPTPLDADPSLLALPATIQRQTSTTCCPMGEFSLIPALANARS